MHGILGKFVCIFFIFAILIVGVLMYKQRTDQQQRVRVQAKLDEFATEIANSGRLTEQQYEEFLHYLSTEGIGATIDFEYSEKIDFKASEEEN